MSNDPTEDVLRYASIALIETTPGADDLEDVERIVGRPWLFLLAEATSLRVSTVLQTIDNTDRRSNN